jgi:hypothetical protein
MERPSHQSLYSTRWIQSTSRNLVSLTYFNISVPSTPRPTEWSLPLKLSNQILYAFITSPMRTTYPSHFILLYLIILFVKRTNYRASHSETFCSLPLLNPSWVQIFFLAPCSQSISICVLPLIWEATFHTHWPTKQQVELLYFIF